MYLNSTNPGIKAIEDFTKTDRIALPYIRTSTQAVVLQMAVAAKFGLREREKLDELTVGMTHAEATKHLLARTGGITASFSSPPYQDFQLASTKAKVHRVTSSFEVLGGPSSFIVAVSDERFATEQPKLFLAVYAAIAEAQGIIRTEPARAAEIFVRAAGKNGTGGAAHAGSGTSMTPDAAEIGRLLASPEMTFDVAPNRTMSYAGYMYTVKLTGTMPKGWKELCFDVLHDKQGS
jgi:NitT/TauT family transport system substrate-binding protein